MKAVKPAVSSCSARRRSKWPTMWRGCLAEAEHHRRGRAQPEAVRLAHHLQPGVGRALERRDLVADLVVEDLGAAARDRIEAGGDQPLDHRRGSTCSRARRCSGSPRATGRGWRAGSSPSSSGTDPRTSRSAASGLRPPCSRICTPPRSTVSWNFCVELLARQHVALGLVGGRAVEVAELAAGHADVRVVDVAIDDVGDLAVGVQRLAARVGGGAELERRRVGVQAERVVGRQARCRRRRRPAGRRWIATTRRRSAPAASAARGPRTAAGAPGARQQLGAARAIEERRQRRTAPRRPAGSGCCRCR